MPPHDNYGKNIPARIYDPETKHFAGVTVDDELKVTATVSVDTTGLATSAKQDTGNTSLNNIDTDIGAPADAAASSDTGTFSLIALFKRLLQRFTSGTVIGQVEAPVTAPLYVTMRDDVSANGQNSTITPLGAGGVFTGAWEDLNDYNGIRVTLFANVQGTFTIQFSHDALTVLEPEDTYTVTAGNHKTSTFGKAARYFRVVYTNGGSAQTTFIVTTIKLRNNQKWSTHKINEAITDDSDSELVKAVMTGKRQDGAYGNMQLTNQNRVLVSNDSIFAEDTAHASGAEGTFVLGVRNDADADLTSLDGDYSPKAVDRAGRTHIRDTTVSALSNGVETAVAGTAVQVLAANTSRKGAIIQNTGVANVRIGITGVTATTGFRLIPGQSATLKKPFVETSAVFAIREGAISSTVFAQESV